MTTELALYRGEGLSKAEVWRKMATDERRRKVIAACQDRDLTILWDLTESYLILHSAQGIALSACTRRNYRAALKRLLSDWTEEEVREPRPDAGASWLAHLKEQGYTRKNGRTYGMKPATLGIFLAAVRTLYAALRWAGATKADPFRDVHRPRDPIPTWEKRQPYSEDDVRKILQVASGPHKTMVLLGAHAGLRASEMMALRWESIDLRRKQLTVESGKGGKKRTVPMTPTLATHLDSVPREQQTGPVLPWADRFKAHYEMKLLAKEAAVDPLGLHALRHYAGTRLVASGGSMEMAARMLGHQQIETTRIYVAWADESLRKALETW